MCSVSVKVLTLETGSETESESESETETERPELIVGVAAYSLFGLEHTWHA